MTVSAETPIALSVANGVTTVFPYSYTVLDEADQVVKGTLAGVTTTYVFGVDYTLSGVGTPSGSVNFLVAPVNGTLVTRYRSSVIDRETDYQDNGDLPADTLNLDFDRLVLILQELIYGTRGSPTAIRVPDGETVPALGSAADRANKLLGFDSSGSPIVTTPAAGTATALAVDLADGSSPTKGTGMLGWLRAAASAVATTLYDWLDWQNISVFEFMTFAEKVDVKAKTYTLDVSAAINAGQAAVLARGGGPLKFHSGGYRINNTLTRSLTVLFKGDARGATYIRAYTNNNAVNAGNGSLAGDNWGGIEDITIFNGPTFTPAVAVYNYGITSTTLRRVAMTGAAVGVRDQFVLNSVYEDVVPSCPIGHDIVDTGAADPVNANTYIRMKYTAGHTTAGLRVNAGHSYGNLWISPGFENSTGYPIRFTAGAGFKFIQPYFEGNSNSARLDGGEDIEFDNPTNISNQTFIDSNFGARNVTVRNLIDNVNAGVLQHKEIKSNIVLLTQSGFSGRDVVQVGTGWADAISGYSYQPANAAATGLSARAMATPHGGPILPVKNFVASWDMTSAVQWTGVQATGVVANPYGGANAYALSTGATTHQTSSLVSAATGRTFTAQVWLYCAGDGVVRLQGGTTNGFRKDTTFRVSEPGWFLASVTFKSPTDASTTGVMAITVVSGTFRAWRPCFYESNCALPAIPVGRDLTAITTPMEMRNLVLVNWATTVPVAGEFLVGDMTFNIAGTVGQPKGWTCTVAGSPGTQTSWGNL